MPDNQDELNQEISDQESSETQQNADDLWADALKEQEDAREPSSAGNRSEGGAQEGHEVSVKQVGFENLRQESNGEVVVNIESLLDIPVTISMELGRVNLPINNLLKLNQGSVITLDRLAGEPLDVLVNGCLIAHGEVVVVNDKFGIRLTDVISKQERVKNLRQ